MHDRRHIRIDCRGEDKGYLTLDARERYSLAVKDNAAVLTADGPRASCVAQRRTVPEGFAIPAMVFEDAPHFVRRGVAVSPPAIRRKHAGQMPDEGVRRNFTGVSLAKIAARAESVARPGAAASRIRPAI
jgi:hypothetical protein